MISPHKDHAVFKSFRLVHTIAPNIAPQSSLLKDDSTAQFNFLSRVLIFRGGGLMSETLWARCIRRAASESLIETQREEADNRQALWGQWKSHVSTWAFPDPEVRDVKFHNAVITRQNLNKPVILTSPLSTFSGKWLMSGPLECVYRRPSTWQNHRQIYELLSPVTSKVTLISSEEAAAVCVLSPSS